MPNSGSVTSRPCLPTISIDGAAAWANATVDSRVAAANDAGKVDVGKLPNELLARLLARLRPRDPRVVLGPAVGRDAAVIDAGGERLLVAKTDPVTFASDHIGWYTVHVNANDIACMGARPAW